jgi:hypothetical protein
MTAPKREHERIVQRWREQLAKIERELFRGFLHQAVWTELRDEIQRRHPDADATFLVSYSSGYVAGQMLLVRRLVDGDRKSDSLASLIQRIQGNANVVTRTCCVEQWVAKSKGPAASGRVGVGPGVRRSTGPGEAQPRAPAAGSRQARERTRTHRHVGDEDDRAPRPTAARARTQVPRSARRARGPGGRDRPIPEPAQPVGHRRVDSGDPRRLVRPLPAFAVPASARCLLATPGRLHLKRTAAPRLLGRGPAGILLDAQAWAPRPGARGSDRGAMPGRAPTAGAGPAGRRRPPRVACSRRRRPIVPAPAEPVDPNRGVHSSKARRCGVDPASRAAQERSPSDA